MIQLCLFHLKAHVCSMLDMDKDEDGAFCTYVRISACLLEAYGYRRKTAVLHDRKGSVA